MPEAKPRYFIGPALLGDIRRVVGRSDETPRNAVGQSTPSRSVDVLATHGPEFRVGRKTGAWKKGTTATLTWTVGGTVTRSMVATNLFVDIDKTSSYDCSCARAGNTWYLVASEHESGTKFHMGLLNGDWPKYTTANVSILQTGETITATNLLINLTSSVTDHTSTVAVAKDGTVWNLISWEMEAVCRTHVIDIQVALNTETCAISRTVVTSKHSYLRLTYPFGLCTTSTSTSS